MDDDGNLTEMAHPTELPYETIERLRKRLRNQKREIAMLRHIVTLMWKCTGYTQTWRMNGEGKHRHLNDGRGGSYFAVEDLDGNVIWTSAQLCKAVDRALRG